MTQYIDKSALLEVIIKRRDAALTRQHNLESIGQESVLNETIAFELNRIIAFIHTLEVKEVDLEKDVESLIKFSIWRFADKEDFLRIAKHFFELGLKAQHDNWKVENLWTLADGDDLPEIDREVIALLDNGKVVFAHRPPEFWDGKDIVTGKVTRNYPKTYDKGGWNIPNIKYWLDVELPKEIEL